MGANAILLSMASASDQTPPPAQQIFPSQALTPMLTQLAIGGRLKLRTAWIAPHTMIPVPGTKTGW